MVRLYRCFVQRPSSHQAELRRAVPWEQTQVLQGCEMAMQSFVTCCRRGLRTASSIGLTEAEPLEEESEDDLYKVTLKGRSDVM
jgi:hypothetical protein